MWFRLGNRTGDILKFKASQDLRRIVVLNPKGGSGKTTLAFNLAGYLASTGRQVALVDMDRQGSSARWLNNRPVDMPQVHGISRSYEGAGRDRRCEVVIPEFVDVAVIDAPAGLTGSDLADFTCGAHAILVPVLPSDLDIHAASRLISELLLTAQVSRRNARLGVVANRVKERTIAYQQLQRFLARLSIAVVGVLRDSQNYTWAAAKGLCIHDMPASRVGKDLEQWAAVTAWLEQRLEQPLNARDLLRPAAAKRTGIVRKAVPWLAAATLAAMTIASAWVLLPDREATTPHSVQLAAPSPAEMHTVVLSTSGASPDEPAAVVTPAEDLVAELQTAALPAADASFVDTQSTIEAAPAGDKVLETWQLSGVAKIDGNSVLFLRDRRTDNTRQVVAGDDIDGWVVSDAGTDYAVLALDGEQVRLELVASSVR